MKTHFESACMLWDKINKDIVEFGRLVKLSMEKEGKTIRDFSVALCGNSSLEDRIGRYVQAAEFVDGLHPYQYGNVADWLTPTHYTELAKIEHAYDHDYAVELMQDLVTENDDGSINVKPVEWLRGKRANEETSSAEVFHRLWKVAARAVNDALAELERKGNLATKEDRRRVRVLKMVIRMFQAEIKEKVVVNMK